LYKKPATISDGKCKFCFKLKKGKILFIDSTHPILPEGLEKEGFQCEYFPGYGYADYKKIINDYVGVVIRSKIKFDKDILEDAGSLKFVARVGSGMENIDYLFAESKGVVCLNAPEGNRDAVGEQAVGMLLSLFNNLNKADLEVRKGIWQREQNRGIELGGKTVGIIGYGNTGSAFAKKLKGFDVQVIACDKYKTNFADDFVEEAQLIDIFERSDVVSFHVPLTAETTYMADNHFINQFSKNIYLINTSRGKVVNTSDLVQNLESGEVLGACLDVLEYEGFSFEELGSSKMPDAFSRLTKMNNVGLSPHIAGWTHESNYKMARTIFEKIQNLNLP